MTRRQFHTPLRVAIGCATFFFCVCTSTQEEVVLWRMTATNAPWEAEGRARRLVDVQYRGEKSIFCRRTVDWEKKRLTLGAQLYDAIYPCYPPVTADNKNDDDVNWMEGLKLHGTEKVNGYTKEGVKSKISWRKWMKIVKDEKRKNAEQKNIKMMNRIKSLQKGCMYALSRHPRKIHFTPLYKQTEWQCEGRFNWELIENRIKCSAIDHSEPEFEVMLEKIGSTTGVTFDYEVGEHPVVEKEQKFYVFLDEKKWDKLLEACARNRWILDRWYKRFNHPPIIGKQIDDEFGTDQLDLMSYGPFDDVVRGARTVWFGQQKSKDAAMRVKIKQWHSGYVYKLTRHKLTPCETSLLVWCHWKYEIHSEWQLENDQITSDMFGSGARALNDIMAITGVTNAFGEHPMITNVRVDEDHTNEKGEVLVFLEKKTWDEMLDACAHESLSYARNVNYPTTLSDIDQRIKLFEMKVTEYNAGKELDTNTDQLRLVSRGPFRDVILIKKNQHAATVAEEKARQQTQTARDFVDQVAALPPEEREKLRELLIRSGEWTQPPPSSPRPGADIITSIFEPRLSNAINVQTGRWKIHFYFTPADTLNGVTATATETVADRKELKMSDEFEITIGNNNFRSTGSDQIKKAELREVLADAKKNKQPPLTIHEKGGN